MPTVANEIPMDAGLTTHPTRPLAAQRRRAHTLGLIGANLVLGALCLWGMPLCQWLRHRSAGESWSAALLIQPWAPGSTVTALSLVAVAALVAALVAGIALIRRAARLIAEDCDR